MIVSGTILQIDSDRALVELCQYSSCAQCLAGSGCGAGVFSQLWKLWGSSPRIRVVSPTNAEAGHRVEFSLDDAWLSRVAAFGFYLPVSIIVVMTVIASSMAVRWGFNADSGALLGLFAGLSSGIVIARSALKRLLRQAAPDAKLVALDKTEHSLHHIIRS